MNFFLWLSNFLKLFQKFMKCSNSFFFFFSSRMCGRHSPTSIYYNEYYYIYKCILRLLLLLLSLLYCYIRHVYFKVFLIQRSKKEILVIGEGNFNVSIASASGNVLEMNIETIKNNNKKESKIQKLVQMTCQVKSTNQKTKLSSTCNKKLRKLEKVKIAKQLLFKNIFSYFLFGVFEERYFKLFS